MNKVYIFHSNNVEDTLKLASILANELMEAAIISLEGDLGAGKTVFAQGLINSLGVEGYISSPTFTVVNQYDSRHRIYHIDAYRISTSDEIYDIGVDEYILSDAVSIIEWARNIKEIMPKEYLEIIISKNLENGDDYRKFLLNPYGSVYEQITERVFLQWQTYYSGNKRY